TKYPMRYRLMKLMTATPAGTMPALFVVGSVLTGPQSSVSNSKRRPKTEDPTWLLLNRHRDERGAPVLRSSSVSVVVGDRPLLAVAHRSQSRCGNASVEQVITNRIGAAFAE